jgi:hypothetical protein
MLENAGVVEGVAADILGHEKKPISYGLYSAGSSMALKAAAINKLAYPAYPAMLHKPGRYRMDRPHWPLARL